jgi:hypothetical protein
MPNKPPQVLEEIDYRFKVSGNLIKKLGEESIANKNVAILELIKNAFDAKASKVNIYLNNITTTTGSIIVSDNGNGMTNTELTENWLNIATPNKAQKQIKPTDRIPVGEKGIGRLSSESLGDQTILSTKPKDESFEYKIIFDWSKYQQKGVLVTDVINKGIKVRKTKGDTGTTLEISKLKHNWNDLDSQKDLLKDIYLLHPPNAKAKNFIVKPNFSTTAIKKIDRKFLSAAHYNIKVVLNSGNLLKYEVKCLNGVQKKGEIRLDKKLACGDASIELYFYYRVASALKGALNITTTNQKLKPTNDILDEYSGIKIYRDGFRVKPYGEKNNDWLHLELDFQNNTMNPRNLNLFGFVNISKLKNPRITDTTTREGIVYTPEFQDLISFAKTAIKEVFVEFRSEVESHKKKAKKGNNVSKKSKKKVVPVSTKQISAISNKLIYNLGNSYPQNFYTILEQEINDCYEKNYPNASFFLSRKLVENLVFNILEKKYPNDIPLWYNTSTNSHHKLSQLIKNLYLKKADFKPNVQNYIEKFNTSVGIFRKEANSNAHNIFDYLKDKSELTKFKINDLVQLLLSIYHNM